MRPRHRRCLATLACVLVALSRAAAEPVPQCPAAAGTAPRAVSADEIPIAHTPPGGYGAKFPAPVLAACTEPLVAGAPDLRGLWKTLRAEQAEEPSSRALSVARFLVYRALGVERVRKPVPAGDRIYVYVERIEQCGNRIVDAGGGTIADARADGTEEHAVHDVSAFDFETPITAIASYEDGVFVLRPPRIPIEVTRRLDADGHLVWHRPDLGDRIVTLERIGGPCDSPPGTDWAR
jgi:acyl dehydratase